MSSTIVKMEDKPRKGRQPLTELISEYPRKLHRLTALSITLTLQPNEVLYIHPSLRPSKSKDYLAIESYEKEKEGQHIYEYVYTKSADQDLNHFIIAVAEAMAFNKLLDLSINEPKKQLEDKIDRFLNNYIEISYSDFFKSIDYEAITGNDYSLLPKRNIKRRLFHYRARLYLAGLTSAYESGYNLQDLLNKIQLLKIKPFKKELNEPTFSYIKEKLHKK